MRRVLSAAVMISVALPAFASDEVGSDNNCENVAEVVQTAVDARLGGDNIRKTRRFLTKELDKEAGAMLAEYIYALPTEFLTEDVAVAFKAQCEQL